jgi:hypothetical protein
MARQRIAERQRGLKPARNRLDQNGASVSDSMCGLHCQSMNPDNLHPQYLAMADKWRRLRDCVAGEDAIKCAGETYVPKLDSMSPDEYKAYVSRGFFYNATARTIAGYLGMVFRKDPTVNLGGTNTVVPSFLPFRDDVDLLGTDFQAYARDIVSDVLAVGRAGTLVDWHEQEARASFCFYCAESILNWRETRINGRMVLSMLALAETVSVENPEDPFTTDDVEQVRVYRLVPNGDQMMCVVSVWQQVKQDNQEKPEWKVVSTASPMRRGVPLSFIPFVFHGTRNTRPDVDMPPLNDVAVANLAHFKVDVDYKHGLHFTALPTAWVAGFDKSCTLKIGSTTAWITDTVGATAGFLEFKGEGLGTFEHAMDRVERLLSVLGARLLESHKRVSESAEALAIRQGGENSVIGDMAAAISQGLTEALRILVWWHGADDTPADVSTNMAACMLNSDYDVQSLSASDMVAMVYAWQQSAISRDTLHYRLERGEILPPGRTIEEELALIKQRPPPPPPATGNGSSSNPPLIL